MSSFYWLVTMASLIAMVLNIHRHFACFWIWMITNIIWAYADVTHGLLPQALLQLTYAALALYGMWRWQPSAATEPPPPNE